MSEICTNTNIRRGLSGASYMFLSNSAGRSKGNKDYIIGATGAIVSDTILKDATFKLLGQNLTSGDQDIVKLLADSIDTSISLFFLHMMFGGTKDYMNNFIDGVGIEVVDKLMKMIFDKQCN